MFIFGDFRDGGEAEAGGGAGWLCGRRCSGSSPRDSSLPGTSCAASVSQLASWFLPLMPEFFLSPREKLESVILSCLSLPGQLDSVEIVNFADFVGTGQ